MVMAVSTLIFMIPIVLIAVFLPGPLEANGNPVGGGLRFGMVAILMPIIQAAFGYITVMFGAWIYNKLSNKIGGIEFEYEEIN